MGWLTFLSEWSFDLDGALTFGWLTACNFCLLFCWLWHTLAGNEIERWGERQMPWQKHVSGCFGVADKKFARHHTEAETALKLLQEARANGTNWSEVRRALKAFLDATTLGNAHTQSELDKARRLIKPWLDVP